MTKLSKVFNRFKPFRALVLGDFLLDTYTTGKVKRISPEAPVPIMEVLKHEALPGGAGNVVLNLQALGGQVIACGRIGADVFGEQLKQLCNAQHLLVEPGYRTPVKNRLIADSQQLLRVDTETISPLLPALEAELLHRLETLIPTVQVVALSDYGKGFLTHRLIAAALRIAKAHNIPTIVDPKGIDFAKYKNAYLLKPNLSEAYAAAKLPASATLEEVARAIFSQTAIDQLLITRSEAGMTLFNAEAIRQDFPVISKEVKDVTGAGDTVLAALCLALANNLEMSVAVPLANIAAGIAIERLGCAHVTLSELAERLLKYDNNTKVFDDHHTYALSQVLKDKSCRLFVLPPGQEMTHALCSAIRKFAEQDDYALMIYLRDPNPSDILIHLLSSLKEVDYVILQTESLESLCDVISPREIYVFEGEIIRAKNLLNALLSDAPV